MSNISAIDTTMPVEAPDSPIWDSLVKRGHVDISDHTDEERPVNIYYELYGAGSEHIVFINGMGADRQMWETNIGEFLKLDRYQCLVYDHRGTGFSDNPSGGPLSATSTAMAQDLKKLMTALGWQQANIVGVSMGGMVALEFAYNHTNMVNTLTLAVTNAGLSLPPMKGITDTLSANFTSDPLKRFESICRSIYTKEYLESPAPSASGCKNMMEYCTKNAVRRSRYTRPMSFYSFLGQLGVVFRHYVSPSRLEHLGKALPDKQILIITGDEDHLVRTSNSNYLADKLGGSDNVILKIYKNAGHGLNSQECEKFVQDIDSMVSSKQKNVD